MGKDKGMRETPLQSCVRNVYTFSPSIFVFCIFLYLLFMPDPEELRIKRAGNSTLRPIELPPMPASAAAPAAAPVVEQHVHIVDYRCKPGTGYQFMALAAPVREHVKKFEGDVTFEVLRGSDGPTAHFRVIERHVSKSAMRSLHLYGPFATFKRELAAADIVLEQSASSWRGEREVPV